MSTAGSEAETMKRWVDASYRAIPSSDFILTAEVQDLGRTSMLLNAMEEALLGSGSMRTETEQEATDLSLLIALSRLWVLGLYETLRTLRETVGKSDFLWLPMAALFATLEDVRMPLAKHQPQGSKAFHPARPTMLTDRRIVGWIVYVRARNTVWPIARRELAEQFLEAAFVRGA